MKIKERIEKVLNTCDHELTTKEVTEKLLLQDTTIKRNSIRVMLTMESDRINSSWKKVRRGVYASNKIYDEKQND